MTSLLNLPVLLVTLLVSLSSSLPVTGQFSRAAPQFYEVTFDSLPPEIVANFDKKHPGKTGSRVFARVTSSKVSHYKIYFVGGDSKTSSPIEAIKDVERLEMELRDTNNDGHIDKQSHKRLGWADGDDMLVDADFDGFFDEHTVFGAAMFTKRVKISVPRPVASVEIDEGAKKGEVAEAVSPIACIAADVDVDAAAMHGLMQRQMGKARIAWGLAGNSWRDAISWTVGRGAWDGIRSIGVEAPPASLPGRFSFLGVGDRIRWFVAMSRRWEKADVFGLIAGDLLWFGERSYRDSGGNIRI